MKRTQGDRPDAPACLSRCRALSALMVWVLAAGWCVQGQLVDSISGGIRPDRASTKPIDAGVTGSALDQQDEGAVDADKRTPLLPVGIGRAASTPEDGSVARRSESTGGRSVAELRKQQQLEIDNLRSHYDQRARTEAPKNPDGSINKSSPEYQKLKAEYAQKHAEIRDSYASQDGRKAQYDGMSKKSGVKSTGSAPKDVRSDGDFTPQSEADFNQKKGEWEGRGDKVVDKGHKVVNETTDETLWKNDPDGKFKDAKIRDGDAVGTAGGKKSVGDNAGGITDNEGMTLDHEKKYLDGKQRGNVKDQAKAVSKAGEATGVAKQNPEFYDKAKNLKNYGDDVTAGISDLGDSPEVRQKKMDDFQRQADAEMEKIKQAGREQGARTQDQRKQIADQARAAENAGDKEWAEAKKKANYGEQKTTSEAIDDRINQVKEGNAATAENNKAMRDKLNKGTGAQTPESPGSRVTDADGPGVKAAPEPPDAASRGPKGGKTPGGAPGEGMAAEGAAKGMGGKLKAGVGAAMDGVQIFNTAQDVKEILQADDPVAEAKKKAMQQADGMTGDVRNKYNDHSAAQEATEQANRMNQQAYQTQLENKLRRTGVDPAEARRLAQEYAAGNAQGYEGKLAEQAAKGIRDPKGDRMPERPKAETVTADDGVIDRTLDVGKGMVHGAARAGTFVKDAVSDTAEIAGGLTEKGVVGELVDQKKESYNNWREASKSNADADRTEQDVRKNAEDIYQKLKARGASDVGARNAAEALANGNPKPLHDLVANLNAKQRAAGLRTGEGGEAQGDGKGDGSEGTKGGALQTFVGGRDQQNADKTRTALGAMQAQSQVSQASTAGDQESRDAKGKLDQAGHEAQDKNDQTTRQVAAGDRKESLGNKIGEGIQAGLTAGGTAFGTALGGAAADKATAAIFGDGKDKDGDKHPDGGAGPDKTADRGEKQDHSATQTATTGGSRSGSSGGGAVHGSGSTKAGIGGSSSGSANVGSGGGRQGGSGGGGHGGENPMVTCPGCGKTFPGKAGQGVECPYCVTLTCPRCSYSKNYPRGQEPESCPMCYTLTCSICGATGYGRRDQPSTTCPNCIRVRCSGCGSLLYEGSKAAMPASFTCATCSERAAAAAAATGGGGK